MTRDNSFSPDGATARGGVWRMVIGVPLLLAALGVASDACMGLPVWRGAASRQAWLGGVLGLGALYLLGEGVGEWIGPKDKVTDPLWRRLLHLMALLALWSALILAAWLLLRVVT